jgi:hypothetical protein
MRDFFKTTNGAENWVYYEVRDASETLRFTALSRNEAETFCIGLISRGEKKPDLFEIDRY